MSVIKSKRTLSPIEYAYHYTRIYEYMQARLSRISKRKQKWLSDPIVIIMNTIYDHIAQMNNSYFKYGINEKPVQDQSTQVIEEILSLQKPLIAWWNVDNYPERKMEYMSILLNREIELLEGHGGLPKNDCNRIFFFKWNKINKVEFLKNMAELHRFIYTKTIQLPATIRETNGNMMMDLADTALFLLLDANRKYPTNKEICKERIKEFSVALQCIKEMQMPIISLFIESRYSERVMVEWSTLLNNEIKLLTGLLKSETEKLSTFE